MYCNVLVHLNPMIGCDLHTALPPPVGLPVIPMYPHLVFAMLHWGPWGLAGPPRLDSEKVLCDGHLTMQRTTDIGFLIPHIPLPPIPHYLLPIENIFTGSKSEFGVNSVLIEGKPVAVAVAKIININLNCFGPITIVPGIGIVATWTTVQADMTLADFLSGLASAVIDWAIQALINKVMGSKAAGRAFDWLTGPIVRRIAPGLLERLPAASLLTSALHADGMNRYLAYFLGSMPSTIIPLLTVGSPLGYSPSWTPGGGAVYGTDANGDGVSRWDPAGWGHDWVYDSVNDIQSHYNNPAVPQYPTTAPTPPP